MERHPRRKYGILSPRDYVHFIYEDNILKCHTGFQTSSPILRWILSEIRPWILLTYDESNIVNMIVVYYLDKETLVTDDFEDRRAIVYIPQTEHLFLYDKNGEIIQDNMMTAELNDLYYCLIQFSARNMRWYNRNILTKKLKKAFVNYLDNKH